MNFNEAEAEIRAFFASAWGTTTEIDWPDVPDFDVPRDKTWVRFICQENNGFQVTMGAPGSNRFRHTGVVILQIFQPEGQGSKDARAKAATALGVFMGAQTTNNILFFDVQGRQIGNDDNGYYQINVVASFRYDEIT